MIINFTSEIILIYKLIKAQYSNFKMPKFVNHVINLGFNMCFSYIGASMMINIS